MFNEAYMQCSHLQYEETFRPNCVLRKLDLTTVSPEGIESTPATELPGFQRLTSTSELIRHTAWNWYMVDLFSYLCGPTQKDSIDIREESAKYFAPADPKKDHPLRMEVHLDGTLTSVQQWLMNEAQALKRIVQVSRFLEMPGLEPQM